MVADDLLTQSLMGTAYLYYFGDTHALRDACATTRMRYDAHA